MFARDNAEFYCYNRIKKKLTCTEINITRIKEKDLTKNKKINISLENF